MAQMTPEERERFQARMREGGGGRGGFGGGPEGGGAGADRPEQPRGGRRIATARRRRGGSAGNRQGGDAASQRRHAGNDVDSPASAATTTIDSLFAPLPVDESRGTAWQHENKQLKPLRLRLGVTDGTFTEVLNESDARRTPEVVTPHDDRARAADANPEQQNNPLMGPQRGGPGGRGRRRRRRRWRRRTGPRLGGRKTADANGHGHHRSRDLVKTYLVGEVTVRALRGADFDVEPASSSPSPARRAPASRR